MHPPSILHHGPHGALLLLSLLALAPGLSGAGDPDAEFAARLTPLDGTRPAQWRVIWTRTPATEATVSWTTAAPGATHRVLYDTSPHTGGDGAYAYREESHRNGEYTRHADDRTAPGYFHHARLTGLAPATTYWFTLESDGTRSRELSFTTAPDDDRPFAILAGGDSRSGWRARCFVNRALARISAEDEDVLALSHGGDYVLYGDRWDLWSKWLSHHELTTSDAGRVLPIVPTRGNHDYGALFDEVFDNPGGAGRNYYRTRLSPRVSLATLNSNLPAEGEQAAWLEAELGAANAEARWVMTSYHRPLYPAVKAPGAAKPVWTPLFDRYGVDVALESDGHVIKRTVPIRGDEQDPAGVIYLGEGGLGAPQYAPRTDLWYLQPPGMVSRGNHVLRLDFAPTSLRVRILRLPELPPRIPPGHHRPVIPLRSRWSYLAGGEPPVGWMEPAFDARAWPVGEAGFGIGDEDDATVLEDMRGHYAHIHLRRTFSAQALDETRNLTLMCRYDDAFVAYLNGVEVARAGIDAPERDGGWPTVHSHEAREYERFPLPGWRELLRPGTNVLALVGYNRMKSDRDFTLDPWLADDGGSDSPLPALVPEVIDDHTLTPRRR